MSYDSRPVSEGGNSGIDEQFSRKAPQGKFRVIGVDTLDGTDWKEDDVDTLEEAQTRANKKTEGEQMLKMYVYDDAGRCCYEAGTF